MAFLPHIPAGAVLAVGLTLAGCARPAPARGERQGTVLATPARPTGCRPVEAGTAVQPLLDTARAGDALCLAPGTYPGPLRLPPHVTLWGPRGAVVRSSGEGTTVRVEGEGARLLGLTVDGSGGRFDTLDAAVHVRGHGALVEGVTVRNAVFGILVERTEGVTVRGNHVVGSGGAALGMRGDAIRLWETKHSRVEDNLVEAGRDVVVWYSSHNAVRRNTVTGGRYGTHFMYSHDNVVEDNRYAGNEVGIFVMYSRGIALRRNVLAGATGAAGIGLGLKESGNVTAVDNLLVHNTVGLYLDTSPLQEGDTNLFEGNHFRLGDVGVVFHSSERRNTFSANSFRDNHAQVQVEGGGDALAVEWRGNDFDDYAGYDLDADGVGDVPYELRSLSGDLVARYPDLAFFRGSPTLSLVRAAGELLPLFSPKPVMRDAAPRMAPLELEPGHAD
ncbi:nitrous oxide reductase family maturation protein NosD [Myxococcus sp. RHSTA-1-4]|uniref:nitrous oxide reductase family maturation protein NosD n=1 Tax=Myxococcus sp. RHSTA-1-4 TaxID=2874601 RepID=UPI001CBB3F74|nr:nitrous oxide reductase family maturation protein NosD [Myxococcus sp. RHSTA-1-4]MBZ4415001.1 nitrous oxide reductase family maturation protein NosD [Myxococcus sp. RHSTA-1-4]